MTRSQAPGLRIDRVAPAELSAFKALRDEGLSQHPEAFDADLDTERSRPPESYIGRLGLSEPLGGTFLLGAWADHAMMGVIGLERQYLPKLRHSAELSSLMVSPLYTGQGTGLRLIQACLAQATQAQGLELITLRVSTANEAAVRLYERAGFKPCGVVPRAVRVVDTRGKAQYADRLTMALLL